MLDKKQSITVLMIKNRRFEHNNPLGWLPQEICAHIINMGYDRDSNSDIGKALQHAAFARTEDVKALLTLLKENPSLLLQSGDVKTPGGDEVRRVTVYEFLLGAGDYGLAKKVEGYFAKINNGEQERVRQYERYKPHIDSILNQKPYDLSALIELIKKAPPKEIMALLNKKATTETELGRTLLQFRKDWAPRVLNEPCMHYNYASLMHAFEILDRERAELYKTSGNNYNKLDLVWRQLIGFEMRRLPGIDRCTMAQGIHYVIDKKDIARTYKFRGGGAMKEFPITNKDDSLNGLGADFSVNLFGTGLDYYFDMVYRETTDPDCIRQLMVNKNSNLQDLYSGHQLITQASI
ncbi:Uncharacterised protein [Legionella beliardensis]|uniref:Uncharacterized protein n=1 Tax=Legionella beliardensis TaxID=91822 RepID=A0A378I655_9GAMM|nr:hypothetical protein [Legionella beliardensis]STX27954.1 Uncharacterised protein [Legionella beliardensis]